MLGAVRIATRLENNTPDHSNLDPWNWLPKRTGALLVKQLIMKIEACVIRTVTSPHKPLGQILFGVSWL